MSMMGFILMHYINSELYNCTNVNNNSFNFFPISRQLRSGYLKHVMAVFSRVGYTRTEAQSRLFDVMWAHDYPFSGELKDMLQTLEPHQKVRICRLFLGKTYNSHRASLYPGA